MSIQTTISQFCHQTWQLTATVKLISHDDKMQYVVTEQSPFHPVSHIWPDHPADRGVLVANEQTYAVNDCQMGAVDLDTQQLFVGKDIPVKRGEPGWAFVTVHCLAKSAEISVGQDVELLVNKEYQDSLSRGHSAGHFAAMALNKALHERYWRKDADRKDPLGHYDFDSYAQVTSFVTEDHCLDTYRLGKTIRKRGLITADFLNDLGTIAEQTNLILADWFQTPFAVNMQCDGNGLTDSRYWQCEIPTEGQISLPCGGTHIQSTACFQQVVISLHKIDDQNIEMHTHVKAK